LIKQARVDQRRDETVESRRVTEERETLAARMQVKFFDRGLDEIEGQST